MDVRRRGKMTNQYTASISSPSSYTQSGGLSTRSLSTRSRSRSRSENNVANSDNRARLHINSKSKRVAPNISSADKQSSSRASLRLRLPTSKSSKKDVKDHCRSQVTNHSRSVSSPRQGNYSSHHRVKSTSTGNKGYEKTLHEPDEMTSSHKMTKKYLVEVDERMNILKLEEVSKYSSKNVVYNPKMNNDEYDKSRTTSSPFRHLLSPLRQSVGVEVKTRPSVLRSSSDRTFGRSPVGNRSVTFSVHNESIVDNLKPASPVSRRVPKMVSNFVDFDPCLMESLSTQETVTIYDDEEDSLLEVPEYDDECQVDVSSNVAIIGSLGEIEELGQKYMHSPTDLPIVPFPTSGASEDETSSLVTNAASSLEAHQQKSRSYKISEGYHYI